MTTDNPKPVNPQAFPLRDYEGVVHPGMTLRDWFAGQAMAHAWAVLDDAPSAARAAYAMADAMLREREATNAK